MMKLYREYGYNPLSGCLPLLLQLPVLIALFAVLKFPTGLGHIPQDSKLYAAIARQDTHFLGTNLLCSAVQAGNPKVPAPAPPKGSNIELSSSTLNCGNGAASRIPYYAFAIAMIATTYFQQRQMQKSSPAGQNPQQQTIMRVMPLLFGVWGFIFPTGLVVYWTTTNVVQIGQQYFLIHRRGAPLAPPAQEIEPRAGKGGGKGAPAARQGKGGAQTKGTKGSMRPAPKQVRGTSSFGGRRGGVSRGQANGGGKRGGGPRPGPGGNGGTPGRDRRGTGGSGARDARDRKKRPDR
jgi:YidC/Oxa1 family membrane protein insertase